MRTKLLRCKICDTWYSPNAHDAHCPTCGTLQWQVSGKWITLNPQNGRPIARAVPRDFTFGRAFSAQ